jgi:hypothetical protein
VFFESHSRTSAFDVHLLPRQRLDLITPPRRAISEQRHVRMKRGQAAVDPPKRLLFHAEEGMRPGEALHACEHGVILIPVDLVAYRMNLGVRTLGATLMRITVGNASGVVAAVVPKVFPAVYHKQQAASPFLNGLPLPAGGSITVTVEAGMAIFYGATVDNRTGDPSLQTGA